MVRLTVNLPADIADRMRDAVYWTPGLTLAWFVASAIRMSLTELETINRAPFPKRAGKLRPSHPRLMGQSLKLPPRPSKSGACLSPIIHLQSRVPRDRSMNSMEGQHDNPAILAVDNDPDILAALLDLLDHEGYHVTCVSTCGDALAEATTSPYNAVLLDVGLPGGEGFSVLDILRQLNPSLPVIILTVFTSPEYRAGSLSHGAFSWVNKPLRSGGASGSSPPGCSSSCIHRIDSLHHVNNSLATLLSSFNRALFADGLLSTSINDRLTGG